MMQIRALEAPLQDAIPVSVRLDERLQRAQLTQSYAASGRIRDRPENRACAKLLREHQTPKLSAQDKNSTVCNKRHLGAEPRMYYHRGQKKVASQHKILKCLKF